MTTPHGAEEAVTGTNTNRDFASLLDDLFVATEKPEDAGPRPTIPFDYLAVAEELHSGRIKVSGDAAAAEYRDAGPGFEAELTALLKEEPAKPEATESEELPSVEPEVIAAELGLASAVSTDFGKLRRGFALKNHPDRVPPHLRQRALARMQVANRLIDEAKRRAIAKPKG
jgi:hypothetical protein